ncbi:MAG: PhzF family phenazine biosynthesis protein, partial [Gammaproteobacteria bacterium]
IVTAPAATTPGCVYRYFAPQYGTPEDPATGSAAVQLAVYWRLRESWSAFTVAQLSTQGAMMELSSNQTSVGISARVGYG